MAKHCCDNGVDEILVYDWSVTDEDHEAAIAVIKEVCRESRCPGYCRRQSKAHGRCKEISLCRSQRCIFRHEQRRKRGYDQRGI